MQYNGFAAHTGAATVPLVVATPRWLVISRRINSRCFLCGVSLLLADLVAIEAEGKNSTAVYYTVYYTVFLCIFILEVVLDYFIVDVHARNLNQVGLRMWRHGLMIGLQDGTGTVLACHYLSCEMLHPFGLKQGDHELFSVFYHSYALRCFRLVFLSFFPSPAFHKMECSIRCI